MPTSILCFILFWAISLVDPELIVANAIHIIFPRYATHASHTTTLVPVVVELIVNNIKVPNFKVSLTLWLAFRFAMTFSIFGTYFIEGFWIYKVFALSWFLNFALTFLEYIGTYFTFRFCHRHFDLNKIKYL